MQNILFGLRVKPTNNFLGTDGSGDAVSIYEDGTVQYDHFVFRSEVPVSSVKVRKDSTLAKEIQTVLTKYKKDIENLPVDKNLPLDIDNDTDDGAWLVFTFYDKTITIDNPSRWNTEPLVSLSQFKPGCWKPTPRNEHERLLAYYNNTLLDIEDEVSAILARYDLPLLRYE